MINKKIEQFIEYGVKFTDEECEQLGICEGDKFSFEFLEDGVLMKKYNSIDIELSELSRETLEFLIKESCDKDVPISNIIEESLKNYTKTNK